MPTSHHRAAGGLGHKTATFAVHVSSLRIEIGFGFSRFMSPCCICVHDPSDSWRLVWNNKVISAENSFSAKGRVSNLRPELKLNPSSKASIQVVQRPSNLQPSKASRWEKLPSTQWQDMEEHFVSSTSQGNQKASDTGCHIGDKDFQGRNHQPLDRIQGNHAPQEKTSFQQRLKEDTGRVLIQWL